MSFVILNSPDEVAALPDGTLISWLPVADDPSSEAVAFVRKLDRERGGDQGGVTITDVWVAPGNGWEPEPLSCVVFPARIILLGVPEPGDHVPLEYLSSTDAIGAEDDLSHVVDQGIIGQTLISGGTYPRDVALQAAVQLYGADNPELILSSITDVLATAAAFADWLIAAPSDTDQSSYFAGGQIDA